MLKVVASFVYANENGKAVARMDYVESNRPNNNGIKRGDKSKNRTWEAYASGKGKGFAEFPGIGKAVLPLYHLADVIARANGTIFFCEDESSTDDLRDALQKAGISAVVTTCAFASATEKPDKHFTPHLMRFAGAARIIVVSDARDSVGRARAKKRMQLLSEAHPKSDVRIHAAFPERGDEKAVADWLAFLDASQTIAPQAIPAYRENMSGARLTPTRAQNAAEKEQALLDVARNAYPGGLSGKDQDRVTGVCNTMALRESLVRRNLVRVEKMPTKRPGGNPRTMIFALLPGDERSQLPQLLRPAESEATKEGIVHA
jgi:hypothetical protein